MNTRRYWLDQLRILTWLVMDPASPTAIRIVAAVWWLPAWLKVLLETVVFGPQRWSRLKIWALAPRDELVRARRLRDDSPTTTGGGAVSRSWSGSRSTPKGAAEPPSEPVRPPTVWVTPPAIPPTRLVTPPTTPVTPPTTPVTPPRRCQRGSSAWATPTVLPPWSSKSSRTASSRFSWAWPPRPRRRPATPHRPWDRRSSPRRSAH